MIIPAAKWSSWWSWSSISVDHDRHALNLIGIRVANYRQAHTILYCATVPELSNKCRIVKQFAIFPCCKVVMRGDWRSGRTAVREMSSWEQSLCLRCPYTAAGPGTLAGWTGTTPSPGTRRPADTYHILDTVTRHSHARYNLHNLHTLDTGDKHSNAQNY